MVAKENRWMCGYSWESHCSHEIDPIADTNGAHEKITSLSNTTGSRQVSRSESKGHLAGRLGVRISTGGQRG